MLKKIGKTLIEVVVIFIIFAGIFFNFKKLNDSTEIPKLSGFSLQEITTEGMTSIGKLGDFVVIKENQFYEVNDVVMYEENESHNTSKIIEVAEDHVTLKKDNTDDTVTIKPTAVVGKIIFSIPLFGKVWSFLIHPIVTGLLILFGFGYLLHKLVTQ